MLFEYPSRATWCDFMFVFRIALRSSLWIFVSFVVKSVEPLCDDMLCERCQVGSLLCELIWWHINIFVLRSTALYQDFVMKLYWSNRCTGKPPPKCGASTVAFIQVPMQFFMWRRRHKELLLQRGIRYYTTLSTSLSRAALLLVVHLLPIIMFRCRIGISWKLGHRKSLGWSCTEKVVLLL